MIFIEFKVFKPERKLKCRQCGHLGKFPTAYHLPKGRYPGDKPCTICDECFSTHVLGSCHVRRTTSH